MKRWEGGEKSCKMCASRLIWDSCTAVRLMCLPISKMGQTWPVLNRALWYKATGIVSGLAKGTYPMSWNLTWPQLGTSQEFKFYFMLTSLDFFRETETCLGDKWKLKDKEKAEHWGLRKRAKSSVSNQPHALSLRHIGRLCLVLCFSNSRLERCAVCSGPCHPVGGHGVWGYGVQPSDWQRPIGLTLVTESQAVFPVRERSQRFKFQILVLPQLLLASVVVITWEPIWNHYLENELCLPPLSSQSLCQEKCHYRLC